MTIRLPDELRTVVVAHPGMPVELVDDQTHTVYVLLSAEQFQRMKTASDDDLDESYVAQVESAMRGGWNDPRMDEYNDYDAHRQPS